MDKLGNILPRVLRKQLAGRRIIAQRVAAEFQTVIGPDGARLCEAVEMRAGTLWVSTSSPALAHQIRLDAETIVRRLNQLDLGRRVKAIHVRIGRSVPL